LALEAGLPQRLGLESRCVATRSTRGLTKYDMVHNDSLPEIAVDADTYRVSIDGETCVSSPARTVPLGSLYMLK
ncbi:MAG: urease subunit alpha, partial [Starkeya sp.]|nr:urease subunit alpha [Starkeya sp.]